MSTSVPEKTLLRWAESLAGVAKTGIGFTQSQFERERYEEVLVEDKGAVWNSDLSQALELGFQLDLALCMVSAGLERRESRGAHSRPDDYPERDDRNFLKHSLVRWTNDWLDLSWKPVTITKWQPQRRTY